MTQNKPPDLIPKTSRKKLSFLVQDLQPSQLGFYLIHNLNQLCQSISDIDTIVFTDKTMPFCKKPEFAVMHTSECFSQSGMVIATSAFLANKLVAMPAPMVKYYYVWDLDWLRGRERPYLLHAQMFHHPQLQFICRHQNHADLIKNAFNIEVTNFVEDFNYQQILNIVGYT